MDNPRLLTSCSDPELKTLRAPAGADLWHPLSGGSPARHDWPRRGAHRTVPGGAMTCPHMFCILIEGGQHCSAVRNAD